MWNLAHSLDSYASKDAVPSGMWGTDSSWHKVVAQQMKISQVVTWWNAPVEYNSLDILIPAFEEQRGNSAIKTVELANFTKM